MKLNTRKEITLTVITLNEKDFLPSGRSAIMFPLTHE